MLLLQLLLHSPANEPARVTYHWHQFRKPSAMTRYLDIAW
jgi:hypothetical protein